MNDDDLAARLARRSTVRRAAGFAAISVVIVLSVLGRAMTEPAPRSALSATALAQPVDPSGAAGPVLPAAGHTGRGKRPARRRSVTTPTGHASKPTVTRTPSPPGQQHTGSPATRAPVSATPATATTATTAPADASRTVTGAAYDVSYGVVQVRVTFTGTRITDVTAVSLPQGGRSSDISAMADPQLRREAQAAQSANIDAVSGASYTSAGYAKSLQSAIDRSHG